jgi:hypothetical protein
MPQLGLASLWLLDGVQQVRVFMFSRGFARTVAQAAEGNPALVSGPVTWTSSLIGARGALATIAIAVGEVLLGLGIAWRPTVRLALAASVAWAFGVAAGPAVIRPVLAVTFAAVMAGCVVALTDRLTEPARLAPRAFFASTMPPALVTAPAPADSATPAALPLPATTAVSAAARG